MSSLLLNSITVYRFIRYAIRKPICLRKDRGLFVAVFIIFNCLWGVTNSAPPSKWGPRKQPTAQGSQDAIMKYLLHPSVYAQQDPPNLDGPTRVEVGVHVNSINTISEQTMDYSMSVYLRQTWIDPRLIFSKVPDKIRLDKDYWSMLWVPDTFFRNEKKANFHFVTVPNRFFTLNTTNGAIWYTVKITVTLACPMTLHKYPLDTQRCPMMIESFGNTRDTLILSWLNPHVDLNVEVSVPQYIIEGNTRHDCSRNHTSGHLGSCLEVRFIFRREIGFFVIHVFVPSVLIVSLSWVSFWISVDAAPARVSLGLLTVLTTTSYSISINTNLPRVSYIKAIDVWMSACLLFVFCALCEYAFVNVASRHKTILRRPVPARNIERQISKGGDNNCAAICMQICPATGLDAEPISTSGKPSKAVDADGKSRARRIDMMSRRCFPLIFGLFNVVYWTAYIFTEDTVEP